MLLDLTSYLSKPFLLKIIFSFEIYFMEKNSGEKRKLETIAMSEDTYINSLYLPCYDHQGCSGIQVLLNTFDH